MQQQAGNPTLRFMYAHAIQKEGDTQTHAHNTSSRAGTKDKYSVRYCHNNTKTLTPTRKITHGMHALTEKCTHSSNAALLCCQLIRYTWKKHDF